MVKDCVRTKCRIPGGLGYLWGKPDHGFEPLAMFVYQADQRDWRVTQGCGDPRYGVELRFRGGIQYIQRMKHFHSKGFIGIGRGWFQTRLSAIEAVLTAVRIAPLAR